MTPLELKIRRLAASLDTAALEALANKGLLRRAQKDLERGIKVDISSESSGNLSLRVGDSLVSLPETGPATASCSCPASGICQHILSAVLFLQRSVSAENPVPSTTPSTTEEMEKELLALDGTELETWAGKGTFRAGLRIASQFDAEIAFGQGVVVRFPSINASCRFLPGSGLAGAIVSAGKTDPSQIAVASVVAFQKLRGIRWAITEENAVLEAAQGSPRTRGEVLDSCQSLLCETLQNGLAHLSQANRHRWATLAVSAQGVNLPRLALALRSISDEASLTLTRDSRSDVSRMLSRLSQTHALCVALQKGGNSPRADLVGSNRTRYSEVGNLDLMGVAAWPWRTASGYTGITVLFWEPASKRWNSWTEARPLQQTFDFSPTLRYFQNSPWGGAESPRQLVQSCFRLMNARRNPVFRLSASGKSRVLRTGPADITGSGLTVFSDWNTIANHLQTNSPIGLKESDPLQSIVAVRPADWGQCEFDSITQSLCWPLFDEQERALHLLIRFDDLNKPAIKFLESVPKETLVGAILIGRVMRSDQDLHFQPYALHRTAFGTTNLCLDTLAAQQGEAQSKEPVDEEEILEPTEADEPDAILNNPMAALLNEAEDALQALAESGMATPNQLLLQRLRQLQGKSSLQTLELLSLLANELITSPCSAAVLKCHYVLQCYRRAMATTGHG